ncbi:UDP-N-acetylmuramoyl-L-alanyl-D-glutamate--2,6-diaminopimelate ligase [Rhodococcus sp. IEGM 1366]|uniref:UDP-N-acetylmuramoyl-L-alanyl-D-glutamate--2, 6-diaminopimelate ligase n=1 Tax=Rhodococcus sp. IEGM 1366 TaxID=3082223 RepID=UPI0029530C57|nr:UDP-N-acetylmuramoyl-L-alanyl-D-glutamate--2,6-diaminopimelate ligase [Rhodococcus sp. IEGM 1366]MDV8066483.1 UDP-N-acetylmuramoyl-L-alanyl-D-glutamate--2,6-diaminopimelate ligase [Rhodococcus sp. IEGM 1366]
MPNRSQSSEPGVAVNARPANPIETAITALAELSGARLDWLHAEWSGAGKAATVVSGVDLRAQDIVAGDLFAALPGARSHGAQFAGDALASGAAAILTDDDGLALLRASNPGVDRPVMVLVHPKPRDVLGEISAEIYSRPSEKMQVIGITGTSGKTTTSYLLEAALVGAGRNPGLVGTIETRIHGRRVPSALTTPEAPHLHALFAVMAEQGIDTVVMEVSSHALSLGRVDGIRFDIGAFTNLSQDHLDFHRNFEEYFAAKARLFDPASTVHAESSVICVDDVWGRRMAEVASAGDVTTVATTEAESDWKVGSVEVAADGSQLFDLSGPNEQSWPVSLRLPGRYNVANAALALTVSAKAGIDVQSAVAAVGSVDVPGRVQRIDRGQDFLAVVDYAHKPAALEAVIATLRNQVSGRVGVVVGAGGDRDAGKRALMGEAGARGSDLLIVTDDNPRTEVPATIRAAVMAGALAVPESERGVVLEVGDRAEAIEQAVRWAQPGDVVLVAGKGHETGQEIDGVKHPFDDREVLGDAIDRIAIDTAHGGTK